MSKDSPPPRHRCGRIVSSERAGATCIVLCRHKGKRTRTAHYTQILSSPAAAHKTLFGYTQNWFYGHTPYTYASLTVIYILLVREANGA